MNTVVFAYNFPHKKTQDFLFHLVAKKQPPTAVIAADPVQLNIPPHKYRYKAKNIDLIHPREICEAFSINYQVAPHNSDVCLDILQKLKPEIGIVAGARILKSQIIELFKVGIVNFHPGLIPEARGLDALLWSIYRGFPVGVTAHFIDTKIDAGKIIEKREVEIKQDDSWVDLNVRLYETQILILDEMASNSFLLDINNLDEVDSTTNYNKSFPYELEDELHSIFESRKKRY